VLLVAFLALALWSPPQLLCAWAVVVFGGCGGGFCGCGCGCLISNNQERPGRCGCCRCCCCCCCVAMCEARLPPPPSCCRSCPCWPQAPAVLQPARLRGPAGVCLLSKTTTTPAWRKQLGAEYGSCAPEASGAASGALPKQSRSEELSAAPRRASAAERDGQAPKAGAVKRPRLSGKVATATLPSVFASGQCSATPASSF